MTANWCFNRNPDVIMMSPVIITLEFKNVKEKVSRIIISGCCVKMKSLSYQ